MEVTNTPIGNPIVSTLKSVAAQKPITSLSAYLQSQDPELAKQTASIVANLQSTLTAMKSSKVDASAARKQQAMQKIAQIKQEMQAMKLSGFVLDPKVLARLAKELAQAVKEYAQAGGKPSDVGPVDTSAPASSGAQDSGDAAASENASGDASGGADTSDAATAQAANAAPVATPAPAADPTDPQDPFAAPGAPQDDKAVRAAAVASYNAANQQNVAPTVSKPDPDSGQDAMFKQEVRDVIKDMRFLIKLHKPLRKEDAAKDKKATDEAEKSLQNAEKSLATIGGGISVSA